MSILNLATRILRNAIPWRRLAAEGARLARCPMLAVEAVGRQSSLLDNLRARKPQSSQSTRATRILLLQKIKFEWIPGGCSGGGIFLDVSPFCESWRGEARGQEMTTTMPSLGGS
ncbi:uncharacterized protein TM35_000064450 [Trypanosoma theileri]|uniref:Uncharacterized protein n=1 Tax=Trypanosoma theileri TaxID=67003 RepID=A0A1X0P4R8_9TRYP|nr:uncharacterized protein TM35_000064450 [Trypanosoma theileri]ORC91440.1 hypothetical protein TM35_000064450 [Trypanosoma theileri]